MQRDATLTAAHAAALRELFDGPRHAISGERIFDGIPLGCSFELASENLYLFRWVFGASKDLMEIDFGKDIDTYTDALGPYLNAENTDLSAIAQRGGKLIMISGSADQVVPFHRTVDYYERVLDRGGSIEKVKSFFRYYIIPGMSHGSGPGVNNLPDWLKAVVSWREKGIVPEMIQGKRIVDGKTEWELPIYPYPTKTVWAANSSSFEPLEGPRGGVSRIAHRFLPAAKEWLARYPPSEQTLNLMALPSQVRILSGPSALVSAFAADGPQLINPAFCGFLSFLVWPVFG